MKLPPGDRIRPRDAEMALERAAADADWLAQVRAEYRGRHDVLDALWWAAHPLTAAPSGAEDPAAGLRAAQYAVYSREAESSDTVDPAGVRRGREEQLLALERALSDDARALAEALRAASPDESPPAAAHPVPGRSPLPLPEEELNVVHPAGDPDPAQTARTRRWLAPVLAVAGVVAAIALLPSVTAVLTGQEDPQEGTAPQAPPESEAVNLSAAGTVGDPIERLERPATDEDVLPVGDPLTADLDIIPGSQRRLPNLVWQVEIYLARGEEPDTICLLAIRDEAAIMSCTPREAFLVTGLEVGGGGRYLLDNTLEIYTEHYYLAPDGNFSYHADGKRSLQEAPREHPSQRGR